MSNSITYDAAQHAIHSVTVFQVNRADVNRRIEIDLKKGQNEVEIKNLPNVLDPDSIRVDGIGKAVIFDVIYKAPPVQGSRSKNLDDTEEVVKLRDTKENLEREIEVLGEQNTVLESYSTSLTSEHANSDQLSQFLDVYARRRLEISQKAVTLGKDLAQCEKQIDAASKALQKDIESKKRVARIVVVVLAEEDGPAQLTLSYGVRNAFWTPLYDLRADIDGSTNTKGAANSKIDLHYKASIAQSTAEDWNEVKLTLSTASPQIGSIIPTLKAITLAEHQLEYHQKSARRRKSVSLMSSAPGAPVMPPPMLRSAALIGGGEAEPAPPPFISQVQASASEQGKGFSSTFGIDGLSTIPSDTDESQEKHKVTISVVELENVELEWVTVPKEVASVFLRCKVKNTSEFIFLPGDASIFMNNNFVAKSGIPNVSPEESFSCSLGVDSSVRVTYHAQNKHVRAPTGGLLSAKTTTTAYSQRITVKNTRRHAIERLIVKDQCPISSVSHVKVSLTEPNLGEVQKGVPPKEVEVKNANAKEVKARWAPLNEEEEGPAVVANESGFIEWICNVGAGSSVDLNLNWEVNAPHGMKLKAF